MPIHEDVLRTARRLCQERGGWTFTPEEVVRALPYLNASSVRNHVVSRCCTNAPKNHPHKWDYFRRVRRGLYEIERAYRRDHASNRARTPSPRVAEEASAYAPTHPPRDSIHVTITRGESAYVAECLEVAVVTQGRTLDEVVFNLREALALHLEGEDLTDLGLSREPLLVVTCELRLTNAATA